MKTRAHRIEHGRAITEMNPWQLSSSSDPRALVIVDGLGRRFEQYGPHYSRVSPGSATFTGCGKEIVLVTECGRAVWAVVYQRTPQNRRNQITPWIWRNNMFRNLGAGLSSDLIRQALDTTYELWQARYGSLPQEKIRTEIRIAAVKSKNPGFCYLAAGWTHDRYVRGMRYLYAPERVA